MNKNNPQTNNWNIDKIRCDFPILNNKVHNKPLVYLDNAATAQKPTVVINTINKYYTEQNANVHRGIHYLSETASTEFEKARESIKDFINAASYKEIIFTKGTTEAINLIATSYGKNFTENDEIIISAMEHHANIVPWQLLGVKIKVIPITESGELDLAAFKSLFSKNTKLVSIVHASNVLGTINPVEHITKIAHTANVPVLLDGAQSIVHGKVDVQALDCDFFAFSAHKLYGPTGFGVLYAKEKLLEQMPPYQGGGNMIKTVSFEKTGFNELPAKFESGTPHIAGAIGTMAAIDYLRQFDIDAMLTYEANLLAYAKHRLQTIAGLKIIGNPSKQVPVISFLLDGYHAHDLAAIIDHYGIAVRSGHHCAMPLLEFYGYNSVLRASLAFYNTFAEIDSLVEALNSAKKLLD